MSTDRTFARYPVGRIVWVLVCSQWARGQVTGIYAGSIHVQTGAGLTIYVHHSAASTALRVTEPYNFR